MSFQGGELIASAAVLSRSRWCSALVGRRQSARGDVAPAAYAVQSLRDLESEGLEDGREEVDVMETCPDGFGLEPARAPEEEGHPEHFLEQSLAVGQIAVLEKLLAVVGGHHPERLVEQTRPGAAPRRGARSPRRPRG